MASLTLAPDLPGAEDLEIINGSVIRVAADSLNLPIPDFDQTYAESPDTEGGRRVRSRPQNAEGGGKVYFAADSNQEFWEAIEAWQVTISALNRYGGTITYEPDPSGEPVSYEVESARITTLPQQSVFLRQYRGESEWVFVARPYGLLEPETIVSASTPVTSTDPLLEMEISRVYGSVEALGELTLKDLAGQDRSSIIFGLDTNYDPADPTPVLLAASTSGFTVHRAAFDAGFAGAAATVSSTSVLRATLSTSPVVICGSGTQKHIGVWRHLTRLYGTGTGPIWVRLAYKLGSSPRFSAGDWKRLQGLGAFFELDLGLMKVDPAIQGTRTCEWRIEAYSDTPGDTLAVHLDQLIPQPGGKVRVPFEFETPDIYMVRDEFNQAVGALNGKALAAAASISGPLSPGTLADDATVGTVAWSNPSNAGVSDDTYAGGIVGTATTHYLKATNFGFALPAGATISGIKVEVEKGTHAGGISTADFSVKLVKGGSIVGSDKAQGGIWPNADAYASYGSELELWGTTWTQADINSSGFGVVISAVANNRAYIDHIRITVYYTPSSGQTWARAGAATDFIVETTGHTAQRTLDGDAAGIANGCFEIAGSTVFSTVAAQVTTTSSLAGSGGDATRGLVLRYVDTSNFLAVTIQPSTGNLVITKRVSGTTTTLLTQSFANLKAPGPFKVSAIVTPRGVCAVFIDGVLYAAIFDSSLATGAALDDGKVGIYDQKTSAVAEYRTYDDFAVWVPALDSVIFANLTAQVRSDSVIRQHPTDEWGRIASEGAYLKIPPTDGLQRTHRLVARARRDDVEVLPDGTINDNLSASLDVTPRVAILSG